MKTLLLATLLVAPFLSTTASAQDSAPTCEGAFAGEMRKLRSDETVDLCQFAGRPLLVVNTASHCGYTPQFKELQAVHEAYADRGLVVLGFPSDSFNQEAASEAEIAEVCYINYGVTFTMFEPTPVRGPDASAFFAALTAQSEEPGWNFYKYLVDGSGNVVGTFSNRVSPESDEFRGAVESLLAIAD